MKRLKEWWKSIRIALTDLSFKINEALESCSGCLGGIIAGIIAVIVIALFLAGVL
jgi:hypothetical protein